MAPAPFPQKVLRFRNQRHAERLGLGALSEEEWLDHFARFVPLPENLPEPLALRYHGHQFRHYNPHLGDGRGFLYAQLRDPSDGRLLDLGTKGSGQTPWSRQGDGRLTLKGGVREVLATEMLEALGVDTSKSFSLVETGEALFRGDEPSPTRSSVLVRLSHGHVRFGSFQRLAYEGDRARLSRLVDFSIAHYFPQLADSPQPAEDLFRAICERTAGLAASYLSAGFVHGVLNSDNMNITGESFDYGPFRFLPRYDPALVAAYFDESGLYAFGRQTEAMRWNLERLADALSHLCAKERLAAALVPFPAHVLALSHRGLLHRLGLVPIEAVKDALLCENVQCFLLESGLGYDRFFFDWYGGAASVARALAGPARHAYTGARWSSLLRRLSDYTPSHPERLGDAYVQGDGPASLVIDQVEALWDAIAERDDWSAFHRKIDEIRTLGRLLASE